jgi:hypothetical protein
MKAIYLQLLRKNLQMIVIQVRNMSHNYLVVVACVALPQGWANFFVGGPNWKSKMSGGPTYILLAILVNNNKPETQTRAARIAKQ